MTYRCIICAGTDFQTLFAGRAINKHILKQCSNCGMVLAFLQYESDTYADFSDYGDYLILNSNGIRKRIKGLKKETQYLFRKIKSYYSDARILDFGSGAGYFCKVAQETGFNVFGIEVSEKLRLFCKEKLNFTNIFNDIDEFDHKVNVIFMFDVIEHLNPTISRKIMSKLVSHLSPNGLLIGKTPNFRSANILLCGEKDPVIWPPSHSCYFTMRTIDMYLSSVRLQKVRLYSRGLSSNSFFRRKKFEKSFLERGIQNTKLYMLPVYIPMKMLFKFLGLVMQPFNLGYQIHFWYRSNS